MASFRLALANMGLRLKLSTSTYSHCPNNHSVKQVMMMMAIMVITMMVMMMVMRALADPTAQISDECPAPPLSTETTTIMTTIEMTKTSTHYVRTGL